MMWRKEILLVAACLALSSGCLCQGICTKRASEQCCPTDIRKTHFWCFGEDAILHGPCGPKEDMYGYERTQWREFPDCQNADGDIACAQPVQDIPVQCQTAREMSPLELPVSNIHEDRDPFKNDPERSVPAIRPGPTAKPAIQPPQTISPPAPTRSSAQPLRVPAPQAEVSPELGSKWNGEVNLEPIENVRRSSQVTASSLARPPLIESSISDEELARRRLFLNAISTRQ